MALESEQEKEEDVPTPPSPSVVKAEKDGIEHEVRDGMILKQTEKLLSMYSTANFDNVFNRLTNAGDLDAEVARLVTEFESRPGPSRREETRSLASSPNMTEAAAFLGNEKERGTLTTLCQIFPDADPMHVADLINASDHKDIARITDTMINKGYMKLRVRLDQENKERRRKHFLGIAQHEDLDVAEFLRIYPNPEQYFMSDQRQSSKIYIEHARVFLMNQFKDMREDFLVRLLETHGNRLLPTFKDIMEAEARCTTGRRIKRKVFPFAQFLSSRERRVTDVDYPDQMDEPFFREVQYCLNIDVVNVVLERRAADREEKAERARQSGELVTCVVCVNDQVLVEEMVKCNGASEQHAFCRVCVKRHAETQIGEGAHFLRCMGEGCEAGRLTLDALHSVLEGATLQLLVKRAQQDELRSANLANMDSCPFCDFAMIIDNEQERLFRCLNPECLRESCRECRQPSHIPLRCNEVERDEETQMRTFVENRMAEAMIRKCPKCQKPIIKSDGCNKMHCPCGISFCYVCNERLSEANPYAHFASGKCPQATSTAQIHAEAAKKAGEEAKEKFMKNNPELKLRKEKEVDVSKLVDDARDFDLGFDQFFLRRGDLMQRFELMNAAMGDVGRIRYDINLMGPPNAAIVAPLQIEQPAPELAELVAPVMHQFPPLIPDRLGYDFNLYRDPGNWQLAQQFARHQEMTQRTREVTERAREVTRRAEEALSVDQAHRRRRRVRAMDFAARLAARAAAREQHAETEQNARLMEFTNPFHDRLLARTRDAEAVPPNTQEATLAAANSQLSEKTKESLAMLKKLEQQTQQHRVQAQQRRDMLATFNRRQEERERAMRDIRNRRTTMQLERVVVEIRSCGFLAVNGTAVDEILTRARRALQVGHPSAEHTDALLRDWQKVKTESVALVQQRIQRCRDRAVRLDRLIHYDATLDRLGQLIDASSTDDHFSSSAMPHGLNRLSTIEQELDRFEERERTPPRNARSGGGLKLSKTAMNMANGLMDATSTASKRPIGDKQGASPMKKKKHAQLPDEEEIGTMTMDSSIEDMPHSTVELIEDDDDEQHRVLNGLMDFYDEHNTFKRADETGDQLGRVEDGEAQQKPLKAASLQEVEAMREKTAKLSAELRAAQAKLAKAPMNESRAALSAVRRLLTERDESLKSLQDMEATMLRLGATEQDIGRRDDSQLRLSEQEIKGAAMEAGELAREATARREEQQRRVTEPKERGVDPLNHFSAYLEDRRKGLATQQRLLALANRSMHTDAMNNMFQARSFLLNSITEVVDRPIPNQYDEILQRALALLREFERRPEPRAIAGQIEELLRVAEARQVVYPYPARQRTLQAVREFAVNPSVNGGHQMFDMFVEFIEYLRQHGHTQNEHEVAPVANRTRIAWERYLRHWFADKPNSAADNSPRKKVLDTLLTQERRLTERLRQFDNVDYMLLYETRNAERELAETMATEQRLQQQLVTVQARSQRLREQLVEKRTEAARERERELLQRELVVIRQGLNEARQNGKETTRPSCAGLSSSAEQRLQQELGSSAARTACLLNTAGAQHEQKLRGDWPPPTLNELLKRLKHDVDTTTARPASTKPATAPVAGPSGLTNKDDKRNNMASVVDSLLKLQKTRQGLEQMMKTEVAQQSPAESDEARMTRHKRARFVDVVTLSSDDDDDFDHPEVVFESTQKKKRRRQSSPSQSPLPIVPIAPDTGNAFDLDAINLIAFDNPDDGEVPFNFRVNKHLFPASPPRKVSNRADQSRERDSWSVRLLTPSSSPAESPDPVTPPQQRLVESPTNDEEQPQRAGPSGIIQINIRLPDQPPIRRSMRKRPGANVGQKDTMVKKELMDD